MQWPIRESASSLEGRLRALGVKVKRVRVKSVGVVRMLHSIDVRRNAQTDDVSMCSRRVERTESSRQRRRKTGVVVAITCACRGSKG